jgi:mevalonate kinase
MKITFEEVVSRKEWIHKEILNSVTTDIINKAFEDQFYEVKILINGIELEPKFYNDLITNIDSYVDREAKNMIKEKLEEALNDAMKLNDLIEEASDKIREKFGILKDEDGY